MPNQNIHTITRQRIQSPDFAQPQTIIQRIAAMLKKWGV